jgi:hypothetical protein
VRSTLRSTKVDARVLKKEGDAIDHDESGSKKTFRVIWWLVSTCLLSRFCECRLTAQPPATLAQIPALIAIGRVPLVLLNSAPLNAPAITLFVMSCFPR